MAKKNKNKNENGFKIPEEVIQFGTWGWDSKKFKKNFAYDCDTKKDLKKQHRLWLVDLLPDVITFLVKYGHINRPEVKNIKEACFGVLMEKKFIKTLKKELEKGNKIKNIDLIPIIFREIMLNAKKEDAQALAKDPNAALIDLSDVNELLVDVILKKKIKKLTKAGIPEAMAFDILCIIPCKEVLEFSQFYRVHCFYDYLYEQVNRGNLIKMNVLMEALSDAKVIPEEKYTLFILFALLERKEKFQKISDAQRVLYANITTWCFETLNDSKLVSKGALSELLSLYVKSRKNDDAQGKDSNRRYVLSTLSEQEYGRLASAIKKFISEDESVKKYL